MKSLYPQFRVKKTAGNEIEFVGDLTVKPEFAKYTVSITYRGSIKPLVKVEKPELVANAPHIYPNSRTLCLFHPDYYHWKRETLVAKTIVSLTAAWIYFYEIWLQDGKYYGPEAPHNIPKYY